MQQGAGEFGTVEARGHGERALEESPTFLARCDVSPEWRETAGEAPSGVDLVPIDRLPNLVDGPVWRRLRAYHEGSFTRPQHDRGAVVPPVDRVAVVPHVPFVLRRKGLELVRGPGESHLIALHEPRDAFDLPG